MPTPVIMPKLGNTVESCIIVSWRKRKGDQVNQGDILCDVETDKATMEVESPASGTLLDVFFQEGDNVDVLTNIAAIGTPGEDTSALRPTSAAEAAPEPPAPAAQPDANGIPAPVTDSAAPSDILRISPRARNLAERKSLDITGIEGTGPGGRIIERDIQAALSRQPRLTPVAKAMVEAGDYVAPPSGSGVGGRVTTRDLQPAAPKAPEATPTTAQEDEVQVIPVRGMRQLIAERMLASLKTTAQLTLNSSADARALQDYRKRLKNSPESLGLQKTTINDLVLFVVSRTLLQHPEMNAHFTDGKILQYASVHLGFAVDTPRGLIVPVIRNANRLSLKQISEEARRLSAACLSGTITPDDLNGATFTVSNLGSLGIEHFTPVLNPPQVGILGVSNINLKPVDVDGNVEFVPHIGLSLTINHQIIDGAPGARFLQTLAQNLAQLDVLLAL